MYCDILFDMNFIKNAYYIEKGTYFKEPNSSKIHCFYIEILVEIINKRTGEVYIEDLYRITKEYYNSDYKYISSYKECYCADSIEELSEFLKSIFPFKYNGIGRKFTYSYFRYVGRYFSKIKEDFDKQQLENKREKSKEVFFK